MANNSQNGQNRELNWINDYLGCSLRIPEIESTLMFTLLWNLFEFKTCNSEFKISTIREMIERYHLGSEHFEEYYDYFKTRYGFDGKVNFTFGNLYFRNQRDKEYVKQTLEKNDPTNVELISSLILIIQRLRNNLFHGMKEIRFLDEQEKNFKVANQVLMRFLELMKSH